MREMRRLVRERRTFTADANGDAASAGVDEERRTLVITADHEDGWLFECARMIVRHVAGLTLNETVEALLGEGTTSLLSIVQRDRIAPFDDTPEDVAQRAWEAQRSRWREEAEARCEARMGATRALADEEDRAAGAATRDEDGGSSATPRRRSTRASDSG